MSQPPPFGNQPPFGEETYSSPPAFSDPNAAPPVEPYPAYQPTYVPRDQYGNPTYPPTSYDAPWSPTYPAQGYGPAGYDPAYPAGMFAPPPPAKSRRGLLIGLLAAVVAIVVVAAILVAVLVPKRSSSHNTGASPSGRLSPSVTDTATGGVVYTSAAGHFRARFPAQPTEQTIPETVGATTINVTLAVTQSPIAEVARETSSATIAASEYQETMRIALSSIATPGNLTVDSQTATTFRGFAARTGTFTTPAGVQLTATVFFYNGTTLYILFGESGPTIDELQASFVAVP